MRRSAERKPSGLLIAFTLATLTAVALAWLLAAGADAKDPSPRDRVAPGVYIAPASATTGGAAAEDTAPVPRIVGGTSTTIQQWPWQVALTYSPAVYPGNAFDRQFCGGTLVAPRIVITAAHCVFDSDLGAFEPPEEFAAVAGRTRLSSAEGQEILFDTYYTFVNSSGGELYNPNTDEWDVVVVELASPAPSQTIKIAGGDERDLWTGGRDAFVTGWGSTVPSGGGSPDVLRVAEVAMVSDSTCSSYLAPHFISQTMVCAGVPGRDTCFGDSGGPLVVPIAGGGYRLVGDTSWGGETCGNEPAVYGRLAANPIRDSLRNAVLSIAGIDVVGSGASPPPSPPSGPPPLSRDKAERSAWNYSKRECRRDRYCRRYWAGRCKQRSGGFRCKAKNYDRYGGRKYTWTRKLQISQRRNGSVKVKTLGRWKRQRGWR